MEEHLKSKTQLKKEADDVQTLGVEIAQLPKQKITSLSLPDDAKEFSNILYSMYYEYFFCNMKLKLFERKEPTLPLQKLT